MVSITQIFHDAPEVEVATYEMNGDWFPRDCASDPEEVTYVMWREAGEWYTGTYLCRHENPRYADEFIWVAPHGSVLDEKCIRWSEVKWVL